MRPAFLSVLKAPFLLISLIALVERVSEKVLLSSGTKIRFFLRFAFRRTEGEGVNTVARERLVSRPPI